MVVGSNSVPCLHPLFPYPQPRILPPSTQHFKAPVHTPGLPSCSVPPLLSASWLQSPHELCCSTAGCSAVCSSLHHLHVFSIKAYYFLGMLMTSSAASFFLFQAGKGRLDCLCQALNIHSKFLLWSVANCLSQLRRMTVSAHEKHHQFLTSRQSR